MDWAAVDALVNRASTPQGLAYHRLGVFAARSLRAEGRPVPAAFLEQERLAALAAMTAPVALERAVAVCDQPLLVLKGPALARRYPPDAPRAYRDIDVLAADPDAVQAALLAAGAEPVHQDPVDPVPHHEASLVFPGLPMVIEVHREPKWPEWAAPPDAADLLRLARPAYGDARVLELPDPEHAVLVAVHSWTHRPLRRIHDLIDVVVLSGAGGTADARAAALRWRVERLWDVTVAAAAALFEGGPEPWPFKVWARDLPAVRERTVIEAALERWLAPAAIRPVPTALAECAAAVLHDMRPAPGRTWRDKLVRSRLSLRDAFRPMSAHEGELRRAGWPPRE